jgi:hypothetical protein
MPSQVLIKVANFNYQRCNDQSKDVATSVAKYGASQKIKRNIKMENETKICSVCKIKKDLNDFYKDKRMALGRTSECKSCHCSQVMKYKNNNREYVQAYQQMYVANTFEERQQYNKQYNQKRLQEDPNYFKNMYQRNQSSQLEYHAKRRETEEQQEYNREYLKEYNRLPEVIEKRNETFRKRYNEDLKFRLSKAIGNRMRLTLLSGKENKSITDILDFTVDELILHLESKMIEGMEWSNYGEWHIDHIKPIAAFKYTSMDDEEFKQCWSLNNLQPLWAEDNLKKSDKYEEENFLG